MDDRVIGRVLGGMREDPSSFRRFLRALRQGTHSAEALLRWLPPIAGGSPELVDTYALFLTGLAGYDATGRALPKSFTAAGSPPAGSPLPSVNVWGGNKYTVYLDWNPGTGASPGTCACQIETADGIPPDSAQRWSILPGGMVSLSNTNPSAIVAYNYPLVRVRLNVTNLTQSTNNDAALTARVVVGA